MNKQIAILEPRFRTVPNQTVRFWWCTKHHGNGIFLRRLKAKRWKCQTCGHPVEPSAWPKQGDAV